MDTKADGTPVSKNGQQFCDYVRLLACCGAREPEALALRWQDVDIERGQLTIGASGDIRNQTGRVVDFNPKLRAHLEDMATRLAPDSQWLFPSPQRGDKDIANFLHVSPLRGFSVKGSTNTFNVIMPPGRMGELAECKPKIAL